MTPGFSFSNSGVSCTAVSGWSLCSPACHTSHQSLLFTSPCFTLLYTWLLQASWYKVQLSTALPEGLCQHSRISGRIEILSKIQKGLKRKSPGKAGPWGCCYWTEAGKAVDTHQWCPPGCRMWRGWNETPAESWDSPRAALSLRRAPENVTRWFGNLKAAKSHLREKNTRHVPYTSMELEKQWVFYSIILILADILI